MIKPLGNRVIIQKAEVEEKTASGIVLTGHAKEHPQVAIVVAIGKDVDSEELSVGDKVVFKKFAGSDVKVDGEEYTICEMEDLLAVI